MSKPRLCILCCLVLLGLPLAEVRAQSPSSIAGRTIQLTISSGSFPFANSGAYRFLPSALDSSYAIVPISGSVSASTGTHIFTKTGANTATLTFVDNDVGILTASCTFTTASAGSYVLTSTSFPGGSQTGTFFLYSGTSPTSLAGYIVTVNITSGALPFASSGSYQFLPASSGTTYSIVGGPGVSSGSGTYSYTRNSTTTGYLSYNDSVLGSGFTSQLSFDSPTSGSVLLQKSGSSGYQTGVFSMVAPTAPSISSHPQGQTVTVGSNAIFTVSASGSGTLSYQWRKNSFNIAGANSTSYTLSSVQAADAATYDVVVSNFVGTATSSVATLTVINPVVSGREVRVVNTTATAGQFVTVTLELVAQGDEVGTSFSVVYEPGVLSYTSAARGAGATGATMVLNTSRVGIGKLGVVLVLPTGQRFTAGTVALVTINFQISASASGISPIGFGNSPVTPEISDVNANPLATLFTAGTLSIGPVIVATASTGTTLNLFWPDTTTGYRVESALSLSPPVTWSSEPGSLQTNGGSISIALPISGAQKFYRLAKP